MKILKYSLFLGAATALMTGYSLFAADVSPLQLVNAQQYERNFDSGAQGIDPDSVVDLYENQSGLPVSLADSAMGPTYEKAKIDEPLLQFPGESQNEVLNPVVVELVDIETINDTMPTLSAEERVNQALEEKLAEREVEQQAIASVSVKKPKVKKAKLTPEQILELRAASAARAEQKKQQAIVQQEEVMPFSEEELEGKPLNEMEEIVSQEVAAEEMLAEQAVIQQVAAPIKKQKVSKKTKLTPEQIAAMKAGGAEKEAVIEQLKAEGEAKRLAREEARIRRQVEQENAALLYHQELLAAEKSAPVSSAVVVESSNDDPYAVLYFNKESAVDLERTIKEGALFNTRKIPAEIIVVDPKNSAVKPNADGAIIVEHTQDGPEVNLLESSVIASTEVKEEKEESVAE
jgi:hypothetical protein